MSFSNPVAEKIYTLMDSICSPINNFFSELGSEINEIILHKNKPVQEEQEEEEEKKFDEGLAMTKLRSFKSIKKGTLLFFGLENCGKTSFLKRFTAKNFNENVKPTLGFNVYSLQFHGFVLTCWDFGGNKTIREYWENYISEDVSGIVYLLDGSDQKALQENFDVLCLVINLVFDILKKNLPILVFANKGDLSLKVNVFTFVEDIKAATNFDGVILAEEGSVREWVNVEESMGSFLEFIK